MHPIHQSAFESSKRESNNRTSQVSDGLCIPSGCFFPPPHLMPPSFDPRIPPPSHYFIPPGHFQLPTNVLPPIVGNPLNDFFNKSQNFFNASNSVGNEFYVSPNICNSSATNAVDALESQSETTRIKHWLIDRKAKFSSETSRSKPKWLIQIPEFKKFLKRAVLLGELITNISKCLEGECVSCCCNEVENEGVDVVLRHQEILIQAREELNDIESKINGDIVIDVKKKLNERRKKRDRLKRKKEREREEAEEEEMRRKKMEEEMKTWQSRVAEAEVVKKKEKEVAEAADGILFEVRRKISDVKKSMKTLASLQKLREVRFSKKSGLLRSEVNEVFEERLESLFGFLKKQLAVYESEEKALQVMLSTEHEADREKEIKKKRAKIEEEVDEEYRSMMRLLFGSDVEPADATYPFFCFYDLPNKDINAFIQVRHQWDRFLVPRGTPGASKIAPNWVPPSEPSSESWASFLSSPSDQ